jgi:hypothetical protein
MHQKQRLQMAEDTLPTMKGNCISANLEMLGIMLSHA